MHKVRFEEDEETYHYSLGFLDPGRRCIKLILKKTRKPLIIPLVVLITRRWWKFNKKKEDNQLIITPFVSWIMEEDDGNLISRGGWYMSMIYVYDYLSIYELCCLVDDGSRRWRNLIFHLCCHSNDVERSFDLHSCIPLIFYIKSNVS